MRGPLNLRRHPRAEPVHDPARDPRLAEGVDLFNRGEHWHAHESWEPLWMGMEGGDKLTLQGLIMAAAMLHQYKAKVAQGVANHWQNVQDRLAGKGAQWGLDLPGLVADLAPIAAAAHAGDFGQNPQVVLRQAPSA